MSVMTSGTVPPRCEASTDDWGSSPTNYLVLRVQRMCIGSSNKVDSGGSGSGPMPLPNRRNVCNEFG
eukprot:CAMPEP_0183553014 /NCGR_PEP_ID=MMETSP0371-20130417/72423_1 /TAXON_ID=268820 /ORGANISM="Peridinium aciculiferum, Strain PAER-2" /LENGTH=66 /DNA_ID=CAMNT_0025758203 /DNA_START=15 /DNA_END=215 /DNA_ORIENTATION=+